MPDTYKSQKPLPAGQAVHDFLVLGSHDEHARQSYVSDLRMHILAEIGGGLRSVYEHRVKPTFKGENDRHPENEHEVRKAIMKDPYCRTWSTMMRSCQEMIWDSVTPSIERSQPHLNDRINNIDPASKLGSLQLNPDVLIPPYVKATDIHLMPGNYHTERTEGDASQGALYDRGVYVYAGGNVGPYGDNLGRSVGEFLKRRYPDFKPERILEIGCTVGHNIGPFTDLYPNAEIHAIDVSAPAVRYGHARAEALGKPIHFHQMNGEQMNFADDSFDLVITFALFHETSRTALRNIMRECHRVLKHGGLGLHQELPRSFEMDPFDAFYMDWDAYYNNEPFYQASTSTDMKDVIVAAGFSTENYVSFTMPDFYKATTDEFNKAIQSVANRNDTAARLGETIQWSTWGAWK